MKYDYVVIGAGVSGMTAAIILAKNGYGVALVEKSKKTAPLIRGFKRQGVYFDTGFHHSGSFGKGEILDILTRYLGLSNRLEKIPLDPDSFDIFRCQDTGFEFRFPYGYERIRERLIQSFPSEIQAIDQYLDSIKNTFDSFPYLNLNHKLIATSAKSILNRLSLKEFLDKLTDNQAFKWVLYLHTVLHGVPPEDVPFDFHACVVGSYYESVHSLMGGGLSLVRAFENQLEEYGIDIYAGNGVEKIILSNEGLPSSVRLEGGKQLNCHGCISTIHPKQFIKLVPDSTFRPAYRKRVESLQETASAYILYASCKNLPESLAGSNLLVTSDWDLTGFRIQDDLKKRPFYICCPQQVDDQSAPYGLVGIVPSGGKQTDSWSNSETGKRPGEYKRFKNKMGLRFKGYIEDCLQDTELDIEYAEIATPLTLRDICNSPFGSIYGVMHKVGQYNPAPVIKINNIYLAGQAVVAPGVLGAMISAFLACGFIIGHEQLIKQLQRVK